MKTAQTIQAKSEERRAKNYSLKLKIKSFTFYVLVFCFTLLALRFLTTNAVAQTTRSFTISPPKIEFKLKPGKTIEKKIKITNNSSEPLEFTANVVDFIVTDKGGTPELIPAGVVMDNKFAASYWTTVLPDQIIIEPKKTEVVTLYLQVPGDARPGGRYVSVAFRPNIVGGQTDATGASVNAIAGTLVYITVEGQTNEESRVTKFFAPKLSASGPITITTEINNTGDIHVAPKATIVVKGLFGTKVYSGVLETMNVFPGTSRTYENVINKKLLFGPFRASLNGYYGAKENLPLLASTTFWVIPYTLILIVLLAVAAAFFISGRVNQKMEVKETETPLTPKKKEEK